MAVAKKETKAVRGVYEKVPGSGIWWVLYYVDGKRRREKAGRKSDAVALYQKRKADGRAGVKLPKNLRTPRMTLGEVIDRALDWYASHRPKSLYDAKIRLGAIREGLGDKVAADLTADDIDLWLAKKAKSKKWSAATTNRYKTNLSRALQLAVRAHKLPHNVARLVDVRTERNTRQRWLRDDEEKRVAESIRKKYRAQLPAFIVALHTGMRKSEQFNLTWSRVDFERRRIFLDKTKSGKIREIPMNKTSHAALKGLWDEREAMIAEGKEVNGFVFQSSRYDQRIIDPKKWFGAALRDAQVEDFHWHDLRHTFCSRLVQRGVSLAAVRELAGHGSITVTTRYAHLAPEHNMAAIEKLDE